MIEDLKELFVDLCSCFWEYKVRIVAVILCLFLFGTLFVGLGGLGKENFQTATVAALVYTPSSSGTVITNDGKNTGVGVVTTNEEYTVILRFGDGYTQSKQIDASSWSSLKVGMEVDADRRWWGIDSIRTTQAEK